MKIYVIMTFSRLKMNKTGFPDFGSSIICGWYISYQDAYRAVIENMCYIWENGYDYALIEEVQEGLYPASMKRWFFRFDVDTMTYDPIEEPEFLKHYGGFTIQVDEMDYLVVLIAISLFTLCIDIVVNALINLAAEAEYEKEVKRKAERNNL